MTFRLMTYNIHQGFDAGQIPSLDAIVPTIAHESPDVVCLQEVVRGWMIDEQHDTLSVIAERLGMQYVRSSEYRRSVRECGPLAFPGDRCEAHPLRDRTRDPPPATRRTLRATADVLVGCTHLDDLSDGTFVRQEQVRTIIREIGDTGPVIVAGDLNANRRTSRSGC